VSEERLTLLEHLFEVRSRLVRCVLMFAVASLVCNLRMDEWFGTLAAPAKGHLVYVHPLSAMLASMNLSFLAGFLITLPYLLYHVHAFFSPALSSAWRKTLAWGMAFACGLFALGVFFAWKTLPYAMDFLLSYSRPGLVAMIDVDHYLNFVGWITVGCGLAFEAPLVFYILARGGLVESRTLVRHWRWAVLASVVVGALICPTPDFLTWGLVCLALFGVYLASILVTLGAERARKAKPAVS